MAGVAPGFLIGGKAKNFESSARLGGGKYFGLEAEAIYTKIEEFLGKKNAKK